MTAPMVRAPQGVPVSQRVSGPLAAAPGCLFCVRPATERVVFSGRNVLGNAETIAHLVCDLHCPVYLEALRELGWAVVGITDVDEGPIGSSLGRVA